MTKDTIQSAYAKITADDAFKEKTVLLLSSPRRQAPKRPQPIAAVAACALIAAVGLLAAVAVNGPGIQNPAHSVTLPKVKIAAPGSTAVTGKMMNYIVYDNRVYLETGAEIAYGDAENLLETKLGSTRFAITENTVRDHVIHSTYNGKGLDGDATFAGDIYTVKGYDSSFRLLGVNEQGKYVSVFDCVDGLTVTSGAQILGKLNLYGNLVSMTYARRSDQVTTARSFGDFTQMDRFFSALNDSTPYLYDDIPGFDWSVQTDFIDLSLKLRDGFTVRLTLQKGGYVLYGNCKAVFKPDAGVFNALWNSLT
jgi:hypothetical protein